MTEQAKIRDLSTAGSSDIAHSIAEILNGHKIKDLTMLRVDDKTVLTDYFVICTCSSSTQVKALAAEVEYKMSLCGAKMWNMDGYSEGNWAVIDFGCVMVHIFSRETRDFYKLDKLWADAEKIDLASIQNESD